MEGAEQKDKRRYCQWSPTEQNKFLEALVTSNRNFAAMADHIGTKDRQQTRDYYYRMVKKIKQLLGKDDSQKLTPSETTALVFAFSRPVEGLDMKIHLKQVLQKERAHPSNIECNGVSMKNSAVVPKEVEMKPISIEVTPNSFEDASPKESRKYTLKLLPETIDVLERLKNIGANPHLAVSVRDTKKVCSIVSHLNKKWRLALLDEEVWLMPRANRGAYIAWSEDSSADVQVQHILHLVSLKDGSIELAYTFKPKSESDDIDPLCFIEQKYQNLEDNERNSKIEKPKVNNITKSKIEEEDDEEEEEDNEEEDTSVSILEDLHVPQIPIATHPSFEYSQDGFDNIKNSQYYTGECRDFWQNTEESIDYCSFAESPNPRKKRRLT